MTHPPIDFAKVRGGIDPIRLEKALTLTVRSAHQDGTGEVLDGCYFAVDAAHPEDDTGGHWVDLYSADVPRCDCGDHTFREVVCKHILAALLVEGEPLVVSALRELVAAREADDGALERQLRASVALGRPHRLRPV